MKVLVVSHLFPSHTHPIKGSFVSEQVEQLLELGIELKVFTCQHGLKVSCTEKYKEITVHYECLRNIRFIPKKINTFSDGIIYFLKLFIWIIVNRQWFFSIDLIHSHYGFPDSFISIILGKLFRVPVIMNLHGSDFNVQMKYPFFRWILPRVYRGAAKIVCVSNVMKNEINLEFPFLNKKTVHLANGYNDSDIFYSPTIKKSSDFLFVGSLTPVKNVETLLRAFFLAFDKIKGDLIIVGTGVLRFNLEALARELGISRRVKFLGAVRHEELNFYYNSAQALVLPSWSEGMPIVAIEALATGTPVLASAVGALPDLIVSEGFGMLFHPGDCEALSKVLVAANNNSWDRSFIMDRFAGQTWGANAVNVLAQYNEIISGEGLL